MNEQFIRFIGYFVLFWCSLSCPIRADWFAPIHNYNPRIYMGGTQNWMLRQHPCGWIYAANNYGVLEYDGNRWKIYGQYGASVTRCIALEHDGNGIYAGATNEFGIFRANAQGGLTYTPLQTKEMGQFGEVWNIVSLPHDLYVQTYHLLFHRTASGRWHTLRTTETLYQMQAINGAVFVASDRGLSLLSGDQLVFLAGSECLRGTEIRSLCTYGQNQILIATESKGLYIYNGQSVVPFHTAADTYLQSHQIYCCAVSVDRIAIGSVLGGLVLTDLQGQKPQYINTYNGLQNNTILSLLFDRSGNLWVGLDQGIDCILLESCVTDLYSSLNSCGSGYDYCQTREHCYFGTNQGLFYGGNPVSFTNGTADLQLIPGSTGQVWNLDKLAGTLFCSHNRGLYEVSGQTLHPLFTDMGCWQVRTLSKDLLLAGTYKGFRLLRKINGRWTASPLLKGYSETCRDFEVDSKGQIWMSSSKGLDRLILSTDGKTLQVRNIQRKADANDFINIFRVGSEILVTSRAWAGVVTPQGQFQLTDRIVRQMDGIRLYDFVVQDANRNLWYIQGDRLMVRLYNANKHAYAQRSTLLTDIPHHYVAGFANIIPQDDGRAIITTVSGFELADAQRAFIRSSRTITPMLRQITLTNTDSVVYGNSYTSSSQPIRLGHKDNNLRFDYGAGINSDGLAEYNVWLSPYEKEHEIWTINTSKEYTDLPAGKYIFHLQARSGEQIETLEVPILIRAAWYQTLVMRILYLLLLIVLFTYGSRRIYLRIQREQQRLAREKDIEILELQKVQAENELHQKEQELSNTLLNQVARNELISDLQSDLEKIAGDLQIRDHQHALRRLTNMQGKLTRSMESEVDWKKFEQNYDQVNNNFLSRLAEQYPTLTGNERRLCVYIRMGLQNKEIAPVMNISVRGVEMMRYRMRKKMNLDQSTSLDSHLQIL